MKNIMNSKKNGVNTFTTFNSRAVAPIKYSAGVVHWKKDELHELDKKIILLTISRGYHA